MMRKQLSSLATEEQIRRFTHRPGQFGISDARPMDPTQVAHLAHTLVAEESELRLECLVFEPPDMLGNAHSNIELTQIFPIETPLVVSSRLSGSNWSGATLRPEKLSKGNWSHLSSICRYLDWNTFSQKMPQVAVQYRDEFETEEHQGAILAQASLVLAQAVS